MKVRNKAIIATTLLMAAIVFSSAPAAFAKPSEYDRIVSHLQAKYQAKKVKIPFLWLAKAAIKVVRPAGVKSFNITLFEGLKFSGETLDNEMQSAMRGSFGPEWSSVLRMRSKSGEQAYMYVREDGSNMKLAIVTIDKEDAAVIRATISPDKLADFINNPRILGISLSDGDKDKDYFKYRDKDKNKDKEIKLPETLKSDTDNN